MTAPDLAANAPPNQRSGWRFAIEVGIRFDQMWMDWCNWVEERAVALHP